MLAAALRRAALAGVVVLVALAAACSSESTPPPADAGIDPGSCPSDLPSACPSPPPSFKSDVEAIFVRRCDPCHAGNGVEANTYNFSTYASIYAQRSAILNQFYACRMPPADAAQPTAEERALLLGWLVCKAPDN
jgi:uncharacterized membrane protein